MVNRNVSHLRHSCNTDTGTSRRCPARHWPRYSWRGSLVCFPIRPSRHPHTYCPLPRPLHRRPADRHGFPRLATSQWFWCLPGQWWHRRVLRRLVLWLKTEKYQRYKKEGRNYFNSRWLSILLWRKNRILFSWNWFFFFCVSWSSISRWGSSDDESLYFTKPDPLATKY